MRAQMGCGRWRPREAAGTDDWVWAMGQLRQVRRLGSLLGLRGGRGHGDTGVPSVGWWLSANPWNRGAGRLVLWKRGLGCEGPETAQLLSQV